VLTVGLTGGIASGKSEAARLLASHDAYVVDADRIAHQTYAPGTPGLRAIVSSFGTQVLGSDGAIDRRSLGAVVFNDPARRKQLNDIVWPLTRQLVEELKREQAAAGTKVFVVEAPLLLEAGWRDLVDEVWLVRSSDEAVLERLGIRGHSPEDAASRLAARTTIAEADADVIIENDGDLDELERKIAAAWDALLKRANM
jgi:dephospho-CoA kinase